MTERISAGLINCGRIGRAVGLKGECAVLWYSGASPVAEGGTVVLGDAEGRVRRAYTVAALRKRGRSDFIRLCGVVDRSSAQELTHSQVFISKDSLEELPSGQYYCHQIEGMEVAAEDGTLLGRVVRIFTAGETDVYEVAGPGTKRGEEILVPAIDSVVMSVDLEKKRIVIRPMEGMIEGKR